MKITGAIHDKSVPTDLVDNTLLPDLCMSSSSKMPSVDKIDPIPLSPICQDEEVELLTDELEFDQFLLDAAEWL